MTKSTIISQMYERKHFYTRIYHRDHFVHIWWQDLSLFIFGFYFVHVSQFFFKCLAIESQLQSPKFEINSNNCGFVVRFLVPLSHTDLPKSSSLTTWEAWYIHMWTINWWWHENNEPGVPFSYITFKSNCHRK